MGPIVTNVPPAAPRAARFLPVSDLAGVAQHWAHTSPNRIAYTFLVDGDLEEQHLTCADLDRQARAIAARLQQDFAPGERALLLFMPGLEYIAAFFGTLYAGMIPVPAYPPDPLRCNRTLPRLRAMAQDCQAAVILGTRASVALAGPLLGEGLAVAQMLAVDEWAAWTHLPWTPVDAAPDQLAFLQYTSGSTATPRGVMITHRNILYQLESLYRNDLHDATCVSWLPMYHDLGLVAGVLGPLYSGRPITLFSPLAFIQRPLRWLQVMSRLKATTTGGPNFAYDLVASKFRPEDGRDLDLSHWRVALTGAEPVRPDTLARFDATFAPYGFRPETWAPGFGLAEATLGVTTTVGDTFPYCTDFAGEAMRRNRAIPVHDRGEPIVTLVQCGRPLPETDVIVVDPQTRATLPEDAVGEIWVRGPGVAAGYWKDVLGTESTFRAQRTDGAGSYLRTGDLGFLHQGRLFVNGRLKELMIFWGRNVYPADIERTAGSAHEGLARTAGAAFAIDDGGLEKLVVVQEVIRPSKWNLDSVAQALRSAILAEHGVPLHALVLIRRGTLLKTSSGKIQRLATRQAYLEGQLDTVRQWTFDTSMPVPTPWAQTHSTRPTVVDIQRWLLERIAARIGVPPEQLDIHQPLNRYVLDSLSLFTIAVECEQWLSVRLDPNILVDSPSLFCLANRLANAENSTGCQTTLSGTLPDVTREAPAHRAP